jgi:hypothetical protein
MGTKESDRRRAGQRLLAQIRKEKAAATGALWKALHMAESRVASAIGQVSFRPPRKRTRKPKTEPAKK